MLGEEKEISIKLSKVGISKYNRLMDLRSIIQIEEDGSSTFLCTEAQVEFYF